MKIKVLQHHIDEGEKRNGRKCPIALAIHEQTGRQVFVGMTIDLLTTDPDIREGWCPVPAEAADFIDHFDTNRPAQAFEFEMPDIP